MRLMYLIIIYNRSHADTCRWASEHCLDVLTFYEVFLRMCAPYITVVKQIIHVFIHKLYFRRLHFTHQPCLASFLNSQLIWSLISKFIIFGLPIRQLASWLYKALHSPYSLVFFLAHRGKKQLCLIPMLLEEVLTSMSCKLDLWHGSLMTCKPMWTPLKLRGRGPMRQEDQGAGVSGDLTAPSPGVGVPGDPIAPD